MKIIEVTPKNIFEETLFCVKDVKSKAFENKHQWFLKRIKEGLKLKILKDDTDKALGFIEYVPANHAWRPVSASNYMFIHCIYIYSKSDREKGHGALLIEECESNARSQNLAGVCTMTSKGSWLANKSVFEKKGYSIADKLGRFELMALKFDESADDPCLINWEEKQKKFKGWHLLYSDQCPWHENSVEAISKAAKEYGVDLQITLIDSAQEAKNAPSGFGVFALLKDGKLLEDHYLSKTRFTSILKKELKVT